jgi:hypothetical protein
VSDSTGPGSYVGANTCSGAADPNYTIGYVAGSVTVQPASLTITASDTTSLYGSTPTVTAGYSGFQNGDSATSLNTGPMCSTSVSDSTGPGSYVDANTCSGAADPDYTISYVAGEATVGPAGLTITASDGSMTYGGTPPTVTAGYSGFQNGDSAASLNTGPTCSTKATSSSPVGSYVSSCSGASDPDYTISYVDGSVKVQPASLTITASDGSMTYGEVVPTVTAGYSGFQNGDSAASLNTGPTCSTKATSHSSVSGSPYVSSCSGAADPDYTISYVDGSVTVQPASLTITASSTTSAYGSAPTVTAGYSGFQNGDSPASLTSGPTCSTSVGDGTGPGSYVDANTCSGAADPDYSFSYVAGEATVGPAGLTITASDGAMTYGGVPPSVTASYSGFQNGDSAASLTTGPTCSTKATSSSPAGSYVSSCSGASDPDYTFSYVAGSVKVQPASLTITASSGSMTYGGVPPSVTAGYSGFQNGDSAASLTTGPACSTKATSSSPVGSYVSSCSGAADPNYAFSYVAGSVKVKPASLAITASSGSMSYGGAPPSVTAGYSGFQNGDSAASLTTGPTCSTKATSSSPVGSYVSSCSGAADPDYTFSYVAGSVKVQPAALTITASSGSMTYGGVPPSVTAGYSGFQNGDSAASLTTGPACSTKATSSSPVGSYVSSCSGASDPDYTISYVVGTFTVGKATPTVSVSGQSGQTTGPVTISVTVSGPKGVDVPTGSVTVSDGTSSCSVAAVDSAGAGSCSLTENASQDGESVTAKYSGDASYAPTTGTTTVAVAKAKPTVSLSGPSSAVTGLITYEVTVSGHGAPPTGKVTVSDGTNTCTSALTAQGIGSCALQEGTGTYPVKAGYTGDDNYSAASATTTEVVNETTTSLAVSTSTLVYGLEQSATFSVTVYPPVGDDTAPSGTTVQLMGGKQTLCVTAPLVVTTVDVTNPVTGLPVQITEATAGCHLTSVAIAAGKYSVTADFPGEAGSFVGSTSSPVPLTVESAPTSTTLSVSNSTTTYGNESSETLTTRVSGPDGHSYLTGSVTVRTGSKTLCVTTLVNGTGKCTLTRFQLSVGRYSLVAHYQGTKSLAASSSKPLTLSVVGASTSTGLSLSRTTVVSGSEQSEEFTAQVTVPAGMPYASGAVTVTSGSKRLCTITLIRGKGTCPLTATELPVGSYQISARYEGSNELQASTSLVRKLVVT